MRSGLDCSTPWGAVIPALRLRPAWLHRPAPPQSGPVGSLPGPFGSGAACVLRWPHFSTLKQNYSALKINFSERVVDEKNRPKAVGGVGVLMAWQLARASVVCGWLLDLPAPVLQ